MADYKIIHEREDCIGCGACAALCERFWKMNRDGKSDLIGSIKEGKNEVKRISKDDLSENMEAAESCPVNVIHIEESETGKRLI